MTKIIVPFPKIENIDFYLENDIDGFIMGIKEFSENFNYLIDIRKVKKYCDLILSKGKKIYISLNKSYYNSDVDNIKELLIKLDNIDISGVIFTDLSVLNIINENNLNLTPIFDGKHSSTNSRTIKFYEKRGVKGVFLSNEITILEKLDIINKINIKSCVTLFGYTNMATSSRKLVSNYFDYCKIDKNSKNIYYIKDKISDNFYPIIESDNTNFFSSKILNGIKEFPKILENDKVDYIFLDDYMIGDNLFYNVVEAFVALRKCPNDLEFIDKLSKVVDSNCFNKTDDGFFNKKTVFKVKDYE